MGSPFYMDVRYEGDSGELDLEMTEDVLSTSSKLPRHGVRSTLLSWHELDPVDDFEINRNEIIFGFQENRNPFIDHPNLVNFLWGESVGEIWNDSLNLINNSFQNIHIYQKENSGSIVFSQNISQALLSLYSIF